MRRIDCLVVSGSTSRSGSPPLKLGRRQCSVVAAPVVHHGGADAAAPPRLWATAAPKQLVMPCPDSVLCSGHALPSSSLEASELTHAAAAALLAEMARQPPAIVQVCLAGQSVLQDPKQLLQLLSALQPNTQLQFLDVTQAAQPNSGATSAALSQGCIDAFCAGLARWPLSELRICPMHEPHSSRVASALQSVAATLTLLDISDCVLSGPAAEPVTELAALTHLAALFADNCICAGLVRQSAHLAPCSTSALCKHAAMPSGGGLSSPQARWRP